jgi:hypothetical protein
MELAETLTALGLRLGLKLIVAQPLVGDRLLAMEFKNRPAFIRFSVRAVKSLQIFAEID